MDGKNPQSRKKEAANILAMNFIKFLSGKIAHEYTWHWTGNLKNIIPPLFVKNYIGIAVTGAKFIQVCIQDGSGSENVYNSS
jgi:hypothetical protein